jgi:hypothetical protein
MDVKIKSGIRKNPTILIIVGLIAFCAGFAACVILTLMYYRCTTSRHQTTKELHIYSPKTKKEILLPSGVELIQTQQIDDFLFDNDVYYLSIGLYKDEIIPVNKLGSKEIWVPAQNNGK